MFQGYPSIWSTDLNYGFTSHWATEEQDIFFAANGLWRHCGMHTYTKTAKFTDLVSVLSLDRRFFYFCSVAFCFVLHEFSKLFWRYSRNGKKYSVCTTFKAKNFIYFRRRSLRNCLSHNKSSKWSISVVDSSALLIRHGAHSMSAALRLFLSFTVCCF